MVKLTSLDIFTLCFSERLPVAGNLALYSKGNDIKWDGKGFPSQIQRACLITVCAAVFLKISQTPHNVFVQSVQLAKTFGICWRRKPYHAFIVGGKTQKEVLESYSSTRHKEKWLREQQKNENRVETSILSNNVHILMSTTFSGILETNAIDDLKSI